MARCGAARRTPVKATSRNSRQTAEGCTPGINEVKLDNGRCVCREGFTREGNRCVRDDDEPKGCVPGPHEIKTPKGRCICEDGYDRNANGRCVPEHERA